MNPDRTITGDWFPGKVPPNVELHPQAYLETTYSFHLFRGMGAAAIKIGRGSSVYLGVMFDIGSRGQVNIGEFTLINGARIICDCQVAIGDYCLISWNTVFMDSCRLPRNQGLRRRALEQAASRNPRFFEAGAPGCPIKLEDNVWVGFDSCVLPGVTIGQGSVIGARSVVTEDVPPFSVAVGNPARVIRQLEARALPRSTG